MKREILIFILLLIFVGLATAVSMAQCSTVVGGHCDDVIVSQSFRDRNLVLPHSGERDYVLRNDFSGDWRSQLLQLAREKHLAQREQQDFIEAVTALGLSGTYGLGGHHQLAEQGNTVYGYSYSQSSHGFANQDLSTLYERAFRLAEQSNHGSTQYSQSLTQLLQVDGANRARVAEIEARTALLRELLKTPGGGVKANSEFGIRKSEGRKESGHDSESRVTKHDLTFGLGPVGESKAEGGSWKTEKKIHSWDKWQGESNDAKLMSLIKSSCVSCHGGSNVSGGIDMSKFESFDSAKIKRVIRSVQNGDMPQGGEPLSVEQIGLFYKALHKASK